MLGNHADVFMTTPMRATIHKGGNSAYGGYNTMPNPRSGGSNTREVTLSGFGDDAGTTADPYAALAQTLANSAKQVLTPQQQAAAGQYMPSMAPAPKKSNTMLYVGIGVAALAIGAFFMTRKRAA
jgi:hypothetical protein